MNINYSSLTNLLRKSFDAETASQLLALFSWSLDHGALVELDFTRPEGQSFNPRPARIAHILLVDAGVTTVLPIAAAFLLTAEGAVPPQALASSAARTIATIAAQSAEQLLRYQDNYRQEVAVLASAAWLDRMRHLHLANTAQGSTLWNDCIAETDSYIALVTDCSKPLAALLHAWKDRSIRQHR